METKGKMDVNAMKRKIYIHSRTVHSRQSRSYFRMRGGFGTLGICPSRESLPRTSFNYRLGKKIEKKIHPGLLKPKASARSLVPPDW